MSAIPTAKKSIAMLTLVFAAAHGLPAQTNLVVPLPQPPGQTNPVAALPQPPAGALKPVAPMPAPTVARRAPAGTNAPAEIRVTEIQADSGEFNLRSNLFIYHGNVRVDNPRMKLSCDQLTIEAPRLAQGKYNRVTADRNVIIDVPGDNGQATHATADQAVYTYSVTNSVTNALVVLSGNAVVTNAEGSYAGDPIRWDPIRDTVSSPHLVRTVIQPRGTNAPNLLEPLAVPGGGASRNGPPARGAAAVRPAPAPAAPAKGGGSGCCPHGTPTAGTGHGRGSGLSGRSKPARKVPMTQSQSAPPPAAANGALLSTEKLVKAYRARRVVNGVSLNVAPGEIVGLLGPNGAGKTTTFNIVVGIVKPDEGTVRFREREITRLPMHRRARLGIGYLTQEPSVFRKLTVEQNVRAILETCRASRQERAVRLKYLLEELDLTPLARSKAYTLSGGEKRRLEITRALVTSPQLLLLDEPFSGIDPIAVYEVQKILRRLRERGLGILITDHNVRETLKLVDRAYLIHKGEVVYEGPAEQLVNDPKAREIYLGPEFNM